MTSRDFCYWLQGYFEVQQQALKQNEVPSLNASQVLVVQRHLALVFKHDIDPQEPGDAAENQAIHDGDVFPTSIGLPNGLIARC